MFDPHDEDDVARRERDDLAEHVAREDAWRMLIADKRGRMVLADIVRATGWHGASYVQGDALATAYREGQRSVGGQVYGIIMALAPVAWADIHAEAVRVREE